MQVTVARSFFKKLELLEQKVEKQIEDKASEIVTYAVDLSPVDTGAFVESWQINPRGDRTRRARSPSGREPLSDAGKEAKRQEEKARLLNRVASFDLQQLSGFTITNTAPHIPEINLNDRLRTGEKPSQIQAMIRDRFS
jgi:Asp-tRNA(Asn)/Glu-tRNA(Gln) amidotransferase C subunit